LLARSNALVKVSPWPRRSFGGPYVSGAFFPAPANDCQVICFRSSASISLPRFRSFPPKFIWEFWTRENRSTTYAGSTLSRILIRQSAGSQSRDVHASLRLKVVIRSGRVYIPFGALFRSPFPRWNFLVLALNQLVSHLVKLQEITQTRPPKVIIRTSIGVLLKGVMENQRC